MTRATPPSSGRKKNVYNPEQRLEEALASLSYWDLILLKAKRDLDLDQGSNVLANLLDGLLEVLLVAGYMAKECLIKRSRGEENAGQLDIPVHFSLG